MTNPNRARRRFTPQQKEEAVALCLAEGLTCTAVALLEQDIASAPARLQPITSDLVQRLQTLVGDLEVDPETPLTDEDESSS